jgi:hypothetical protein
VRAGSYQSTKQKRAHGVVADASAAAVATTRSRSRPGVNWTVEFEMSDPYGIADAVLSVIALFLGSVVIVLSNVLDRARRALSKGTGLKDALAPAPLTNQNRRHDEVAPTACPQ